MSTNTRYLLPALAASLLSTAVLQAAPEAPAAAPAKTETPAASKDEAPVEPYQLKNRSTFTCSAGDTARAPFWPIGWVPQRKGNTATTAQAAPKVALDANLFHVTSILVGTGTTASLAVINGRAYSEGEFLKMPRLAVVAPTTSGKPAAGGTRIRIQRITDGTVVVQRDDQTITLALQRPELVQHKVEEQLPEEDER